MRPTALPADAAQFLAAAAAMSKTAYAPQLFTLRLRLGGAAVGGGDG